MKHWSHLKNEDKWLKWASTHMKELFERRGVVWANHWLIRRANNSIGKRIKCTEFQLKSNNLLCYRFLLLHSCFYIQINHPLYYCTSDSICYSAKPLLIQCWIWNRMKSFNFIWNLLIYSASVSFYVRKRFHFELFVFFCFLQLFTLFFFQAQW